MENFSKSVNSKFASLYNSLFVCREIYFALIIFIEVFQCYYVCLKVYTCLFIKCVAIFSIKIKL
uniref:Uncharacterized protein n=1 Tax=Ciona intestinalis TaxID=7719 RepID=H2XTU9_CIOIN